MKGLPSLLFQGLTLGVILLYNKDLIKVFTLKHLAGILIFAGITGSYYYALLSQNPGEDYFSILLEESTKRTFIEYGIWRTILHFFTFPFEQFYHLLPWSFLIIFLFRRRFYENIRKSWYLSSLALVFLVNIPVYWVSVETYPRYLFMLYPILLILVINHYFLEFSEKGLFRSISDRFFMIILWITIPAIMVGTLIYPFSNPDPVKTVMILSVVFLTGMVLFFRKLNRYRLELIIVVILVLRIGFNLVILPERKAVSREQVQKEQAEAVAQITAGSPLYLYKNTVISVENSFYISKNRGTILTRTDKAMSRGNYYLIDERVSPRKQETTHYRFEVRWKNTLLRLISIEE
jgi:4-amino-4-deoxy-L-arabinose transferase-like glycosyltransferase